MVALVCSPKSDAGAQQVKSSAKINDGKWHHVIAECDRGAKKLTRQDILSAAHTSKGGFYNHFASKESLFYEVLDEARTIWRDRNLKGLDQTVECAGIPLAAHLNQRFTFELMDFDMDLAHCVFLNILLETIVATRNPPMQSLFCSMARICAAQISFLFASNSE